MDIKNLVLNDMESFFAGDGRKGFARVCEAHWNCFEYKFSKSSGAGVRTNLEK